MCFVTNGHLTRDRARDGAIITNYKLSTRGAQQPETISLSHENIVTHRFRDYNGISELPQIQLIL